MLILFLVLAWVVLIVLVRSIIYLICELQQIKRRVYPGDDHSRILTSDWFEDCINNRIKNVCNSQKKLVGWFMLDAAHRKQVTRIVQESNTEYEVEYIYGTICTLIGPSTELKKKWIPKKSLIRYMSYAEISDKILEIVEQIKKKK